MMSEVLVKIRKSKHIIRNLGLYFRSNAIVGKRDLRVTNLKP